MGRSSLLDATGIDYRQSFASFNGTTGRLAGTYLADGKCVKDASDGWHQFGISVAHAKAWQKASKRSKWTMILEQDAQQTRIKRPHRSWFEMANYLIAVAPKDAEFIWLSGQRDTCHTPLHPGNGVLKKKDGLFAGCASFCPHTYAISASGAHKLLHAARKRNIYAAVDIFLIKELNSILKSYMVNDEYLKARGDLDTSVSSKYSPRNTGIGFQMFGDDAPKK